MEIEKTLEGTELGETSAPKENNTVPGLNSTPVPTPEETENANLETEENSDVEVNEETPDTQTETPLVREDENTIETPALKTFTQNQVNDIVGKTRVDTREKTFRYIYDRYGVNNEDELDELVGNSQKLDIFKERYETEKNDWGQQLQQRDNELGDIKEKVALMESGIDSSRYEDAKFILKGKGLDVTLENITNELQTHPEWKKVERTEGNPNFTKINKDENVISKISVLGNDTANTANSGEDEKSYAFNKYFKI